MQRIQIDHERCILCEKCAQVCTANIIREKEGKMVPKDVDCIRCGHCVAVCPAKAITLGGIGPIEEERFDKELLQKQLPLLVRQRRSMRLFKDKSVTAQDIAPIMDMVRYAPTGKNRQAVGYILLTGKALQDFVAYSYKLTDSVASMALFSNLFYEKDNDILFRKAPAVLIAYAPEEFYTAIVDVSIALTIFDLAAPLYGIGACWAGFLMNLANQNSHMSTHLNIPQGNKILGVLLVGHSDISYVSTPNRNNPRLKVMD